MDKLKDEGLKSYKADEDEVDTKLINTYITWLKSQDWGPQFTDEIADDIEDSYNKGAQRTYWGIGADFNLPSSEAQTHIANRGLKLKDSPERIKQEIISALSKDKYTVDELRKTLSKKFNLGESRAKNIAQTETTNAYNAGRTKGMEKLGIKKKQWINSGDSNVRDSHRIESIVNVDQPFVLRDGYKVFYPGDGDPEHSCYCRCSVISVIDDGTEKQLLNTLLGVQEK
jgi:SPP1 gp7 family putative phage head morphogenesis protein